MRVCRNFRGITLPVYQHEKKRITIDQVTHHEIITATFFCIADILLTSKAKKQTQTSKKNSKPVQIEKGGHIVYPDDEAVITPFLFMLLSQVEPCQFTDADRYIARSKCDTGFNGFQCRHCSGHAGLGKYFPTSLKALSTNSTSQNIFSHLLKCRKCPEDVKEGLKKMKAEKGHWTRRTTGWRQRFFEQVWKRLHGEDGP